MTDLGRYVWKWECMCHAAFPGRAPCPPRRRCSLPSLLQHPVIRGRRQGPRRAEFGGKTCFFFSFFQRFTGRSDIYLSLSGGGERAGGVTLVPPGRAEEE